MKKIAVPLLLSAIVLGAESECSNSELAALRHKNDINYHYPKYYPHAVTMVHASTPFKAIRRPSSPQRSAETKEKSSPLPVSLQMILGYIRYIPITREIITTYLNSNTHLIPFFLQVTLTQLVIADTRAYIMLVAAILTIVTVFKSNDGFGRVFFGSLSLIIYAFIFFTDIGVLPLRCSRVACNCLTLAGYACAHREYGDLYTMGMFLVSLFVQDRHLLFALLVIAVSIARFIFYAPREN